MRLWAFAFCFLFAAAEVTAARPTLSQTIRAKTELEDSSDQDSSETDETEVVEQPVQRAEPAPPAKDAAPGDVHAVVKGDTLWDLSQRYLGSPWVWPKVWSYNPEIENPHWIYPGEHVRFFPNGEEVASGGGDATGPGELSTRLEASDSLDAIREPEAGVRMVGQIGSHAKRTVTIGRQGYLTPTQLEASGVISASFSEKLALSFPDTCYVTFRKPESVKIGGQYIVFRAAGEVIHPITHKRHGYLTHILGTVRILKEDRGVVVAQVNPDTWDEVLRGDLIGPAGEQMLHSVAPRRNDRDLKGYVIGVVIPYLTTLGVHQVAIVDKGSSDGVQLGQTFTVIRQQDPLELHTFLNPAKGQNPKLPVEDVGVCMAVEVKETATMCLLSWSIREIVYGDRVEMRTRDDKEPRASLP